MKKWFSVFLFSAALWSCSTSNFQNIEGEWVVEGYNCDNISSIQENIKILKEAEIFYAIKLTGDACIEAGDTSWFGTEKEEKIVGRIKGMNPQTREFRWSKCEIYENLGFLFLSVDNYMVLKMKRK